MKDAVPTHSSGRIGRIVFAVVMGILSLAIILPMLYSTSLTSRVIVKNCGFFESCAPGNVKEKVRVVEFNPVNPITLTASTIIVVIYPTLLVVLLLKRADKRSRNAGITILIMWWILLLIGVSYILATNSSRSSVETVGALTYEEYACQLKAVHSLDTLSPETPDCPRSPAADAYWKLEGFSGR